MKFVTAAVAALTLGMSATSALASCEEGETQRAPHESIDCRQSHFLSLTAPSIRRGGSRGIPT